MTIIQSLDNQSPSLVKTVGNHDMRSIFKITMLVEKHSEKLGLRKTLNMDAYVKNPA